MLCQEKSGNPGSGEKKKTTFSFVFFFLNGQNLILIDCCRALVSTRLKFQRGDQEGNREEGHLKQNRF
jgi:hypothetical protein